MKKANDKRVGQRWRGAVVLVVLCGLGTAGPAHANHDTRSSSPGDGIAAVVGGISLVSIGLPGLVTMAGMASSADTGWRVAGVVFGTLNLTAGTAGMLIGGTKSSVAAGISAVHLAIGAFNVGLSIYRSVSAKPGVERVSLVPISGAAAKGSAFAGAAIKIAAF